MEDGDRGKHHASSVIQDFVVSKSQIGCISWQVYIINIGTMWCHNVLWYILVLYSLRLFDWSFRASRPYDDFICVAHFRHFITSSVLHMFYVLKHTV